MTTIIALPLLIFFADVVGIYARYARLKHPARHKPCAVSGAS
ncbi:MAG: hypothetical protein ACUVQ2_00075 [Dissulfurimicrobium sp.]